jgi:hypothetical protein
MSFMQIGIDASGKFSTSEGFEPSTLAGAVMPASACAEIGAWTVDALTRWGCGNRLRELHAKEMRWDARLQTCHMLAGRRDVRLAVVVTDQVLLGSRAAVAKHRQRQLEKVRARHPATSDGRERRAVIEALQEDARFADHEYVLGVLTPLVAFGSLQQALCYFRGEEWREEMTTISVMADEEAPKTAQYCATSLFPVIGGDPRFRPVIDPRWREEPVHPLLAKAMHPDGDGLRPQHLLSEIQWVSSHDHVAVQIADVAAWVVRRAVARPDEAVARECFELLRPLLEGEDGRAFELFSPRRLTIEDLALYAHLQHGEQPQWWLVRAVPGGA